MILMNLPQYPILLDTGVFYKDVLSWTLFLQVLIVLLCSFHLVRGNEQANNVKCAANQNEK